MNEIVRHTRCSSCHCRHSFLRKCRRRACRCDVAGTVPGGLHLEMTGDDVTECIGGGSDIKGGQLGDRYHTHCDPRLNAEQALEMAFFVSSRLRKSEPFRR